MFKKWGGWGNGLDSYDSGEGQVAGVFECGNESSDLKNAGNFLTRLERLLSLREIRTFCGIRQS
jgi:hypothetical protein